tara:strand:+ start:270 stop:926 length:657 start_codon:yes stop_codon:yes gene_type:complete
MSGKSGLGGRSSGKSSGGGLATSISEDLLESITADVAAAVGTGGGGSGTSVSEVTAHSITAAAGTDVFTTLTHNLGTTNYLIQLFDSSGNNIVVPFTRSENNTVFYFGDVSNNTTYTALVSGGNDTAIEAAISNAVIEAIAASSSLLPEIKSYTITANVGSNVFETLTHNLGASDYVVQIIDSNKNNIVIPFTRSSNDVVFYFGEVTSQESYSIIIVH